jgi:cellulose synthase/poly-beta-1,6-N-acetylglucosamine synthase-like glycosyltransferase
MVVLSYAAMMWWYGWGWKKMLPFVNQNKLASFTRISVILPVRNEEKNIEKVVRCIATQNYPIDKYEIMVVDDFSEDTTAAMVKRLNIPNLKLLQPKSGLGKKNAITEGILFSTAELIVTTDADCEMGTDWLTSIHQFYKQEEAVFIIAPVLVKNEKSFLSTIQFQEIAVLTACAATSAHCNVPVLCSGANLAYKREAFVALGGYAGNEHIATGDDIFLMLKMQKQYGGQVKFLKSKDALVYTTAERTIRAMVAQRKRWASKALAYGLSHATFISFLVFSCNASFPLMVLLCVFKHVSVATILFFLPVKIAADYFVLQSVNKFFSAKTNFFYFLIISLVYPFYVFMVGCWAPFTRYKWKGRNNR